MLLIVRFECGYVITNLDKLEEAGNKINEILAKRENEFCEHKVIDIIITKPYNPNFEIGNCAKGA